MTHPPTPEQEAILSAARSSQSSLMISAYAGCGKTSTLELVAMALQGQPALALAFNVKIKKELEKRFPPNFKVMTLNGLGHNAWAKAIGRQPQVDEKKLGKLVSQASKDAGEALPGDLWSDLLTLVTKAMQAGLVPSVFPARGLLWDSPEAWQGLCEENFLEIPTGLLPLAREVLIRSIKQAFPTPGNTPVISFDDQIYLSTMLGGVFGKYPLVLVDEAQDLSPLNHIQLAKSSSGRLVVCGDPKQAIYGFRGAHTESMEKIRGLRQDWVDLPLATTFRCPKVIVERQAAHAPGFTAFHTAPRGEILSLEDTPWTWPVLAAKLPSSQSSLAILCRNNAPIIALAFKLIRQGIGCCMLGRDIGKGLTALAKKILPEEDIPAEACAQAIQAWMEKEISLARANDKEGKVAGIKDRGECLLAVLAEGQAKTSGELRQRLKDLFSKDSGMVTLATGHRAKGLEWDLVLHLDPWRIPSKFALQNPGQLSQELNIRYVIETRAKKTLVLANLGDFS